MGRGGGNMEGGSEEVKMEDAWEWVLKDGGCWKRMFFLNNLFITNLLLILHFHPVSFHTLENHPLHWLAHYAENCKYHQGV